MWHQIKQLKIDVPADTIHPTHQLVVLGAHNAAEFVPRCSVCIAIYGVTPHVHINDTPSSTNVVDLDGLAYCKYATYTEEVCASLVSPSLRLPASEQN